MAAQGAQPAGVGLLAVGAAFGAGTGQGGTLPNPPTDPDRARFDDGQSDSPGVSARWADVEDVDGDDEDELGVYVPVSTTGCPRARSAVTLEACA